MSVRTSIFATTLALSLALVNAGGNAHAQRANQRAQASACGTGYLYLAEGNTWTYQPLGTIPGGPPPSNLTLKVAKIETAEGVTSVTLEETYREVTYTHVATCSKDGIVLPPGSFLFAAEPGGATAVRLANIAQQGASYPSGKSVAVGKQWFVEFKADVERTPAEGSNATHPAARVEIERLATVYPTETLDVPLGRFRATRIGFEIRGRGVVGETNQEIPVGQEGAMWIAPRIGIVRAREVSGRAWELIDTNAMAR
jgi:hypothetical protein